MIDGTLIFPETTLNVNGIVGFQVTNKTIIYHTFHSLKNTPSKEYWSVRVRSRPGLGVETTISFRHDDGKLPEDQILSKIYSLRS